MKTDKELLLLLQTNPKLALDLFKIKTKAHFQIHAEEFKSMSRRCDMCLTSKDSEIVYIIEFQAHPDKTIYLRGAMERIMYSQNHLDKTVCLILCFLDPKDDPKTEPYYSLAKDGNPFFQVVYLEELVKDLEKEEPEHLLVSVFFPLFTKDKTKILETAPVHFENLVNAGLEKDQEDILIKVFNSWLLNRLPQITEEELKVMLADLHPLEDTTFYKEVIQKGMKKGIQEGIQEGEKGILAKQFQQRFGALPQWAKTRLDQASPNQILRWSEQVLTGETLEDVMS